MVLFSQISHYPCGGNLQRAKPFRSKRMRRIVIVTVDYTLRKRYDSCRITLERWVLFLVFSYHSIVGLTLIISVDIYFFLSVLLFLFYSALPHSWIFLETGLDACACCCVVRRVAKGKSVFCHVNGRLDQLLPRQFAILLPGFVRSFHLTRHTRRCWTYSVWE